MVNQNERGKDTTLTVNGRDFAITNFEYDIEENNSSSEFNDSDRPVETNISNRLTGTFEWDGSLEEARSALYTADGFQRENIRIQHNATEERVRATEITIQNLNRSFAMDGTTSGSVEFSSTNFRLPSTN